MPRSRRTRQSGARSPSSASTWPRFGALARQVKDRDKAGRAAGAGEAAEPELSPTSESNDSGLREPLDWKRYLDNRLVEPDIERLIELDKRKLPPRLLPLPCLLPCPSLAFRRLCR